MALRLFVIAFLNSSAYIVLWNRFYNACQYTPLLAAHQELWELVLSWFFSGKTSRLRLEMNGRCLKKPTVSDFRAGLLLLLDLFQKEDTFGGKVLYSQTAEYFENGVNTYMYVLCLQPLSNLDVYILAVSSYDQVSPAADFTFYKMASVLQRTYSLFYQSLWDCFSIKRASHM